MKLTPQRRNKIIQPNTCYVIRCYTFCSCLEKGIGCNTGFFSIFIRALYGIKLAVRYQVPYYVDCGSMPHLYSDPDRFAGDVNFWNYYFRQPAPGDLSWVYNTHYETFPVRVWHRTVFHDLHNIIQNYIYLQPAVERLVKEKAAFFKKKKVLGVHIRRTDHATEIEPVRLATFKKAIDKVFHHYDQLFVATDDASTLEAMVQAYGNRVIYNHAERSTDGRPVHEYSSFENRYALGLEALLDAYCLSFCSKAILLHSNLSYAALLLNPTLDYVLLETPKHRNQRLKTLLTYYLDGLSKR